MKTFLAPPCLTWLLAMIIWMLCMESLSAHTGHDHDEEDGAHEHQSTKRYYLVAMKNTPVNEVTISIKDGFRKLQSNGVPDHKPGAFPNRGNPHTLSEQSYLFRMTMNPTAVVQPIPAHGALFGVALNGVPFEPGTGEFWRGDWRWNYEALGGFINLGLDNSNAHVQPSGAYHYHGLPVGLVQTLIGDGKTMTLLGWAADGFPIYTSFAPTEPMKSNSPLKEMKSSYQLRQGDRISGPGDEYDGRFTADFEYVAGSGDLDACNGRFGITPEFPDGIYYYCITNDFPWVSRYWRGTPDPSFFKHRPGPGGGSDPGIRPGGPPRGRPPFPPPMR